MQNPRNEPILEYRSGSAEKKLLDQAVDKFYKQTTDVPIIIGKDEIRTKDVHNQVMVRFSFNLLFLKLYVCFTIISIYYCSLLSILDR